jgi:protein TonB
MLFNDRFTLSVMLAMGIHAFVLLAVGFRLDFEALKNPIETLDVVLVNWRTEKPPEDAEFLAQASQKGGGESEQRSRPADELSARAPVLSEGDAPVQQDLAVSTPSEMMREQVTQQQSEIAIKQEITEIQQPQTPVLSSAELLMQSRQLAQMQPEISRDSRFESKLPRREFISANTREFEFAAYMRAWVAKVERVGNLSYPEALRKRGMVGDLVLTVGIRQDGSVDSIDVWRGSGTPELDRAAVKIVQLAAPYSPLPDNIRERIDVLHITRTWRFSAGSRFSTEKRN